MLLQKGLDGVVHPQVQEIPVIQPRPLHRLVRNIEAQGADQMQSGPGDGAGAGDIAGVLGDLRLYQDDVDQG